MPKESKQKHIMMQSLALAALRPATQGDYLRDSNILFRMCEIKKIKELREDEFLMVMMEYVEAGYSASRIEKFRGAVAHFQCTEMVKSARWTRDEGFKKRFKGLLSLCATSRLRGGITVVKLRELCARCPEEWKLGIILGYTGLLRVSEMKALTKRDIEFAGEDAYARVIGPKGYKASGGRAAKVFMVHLPLLQEYIAEMVAPLKAGDQICAEWDDKQVNAFIQAVAKELEWDPTMQWSFHSLRHGAAMDLQREGVELSDRKRLGRWKSNRMAQWYARPCVQ